MHSWCTESSKAREWTASLSPSRQSCCILEWISAILLAKDEELGQRRGGAISPRALPQALCSLLCAPFSPHYRGCPQPLPKTAVAACSRPEGQICQRAAGDRLLALHECQCSAGEFHCLLTAVPCLKAAPLQVLTIFHPDTSDFPF